FVEMTNEKIEECLSKLTKETKPKWGSMSAQHMIEHLEFNYRIASGEIQNFEIKTAERILEKVHNTLYNYEKMPHDHMYPLAEESKIHELKYTSIEDALEKMKAARIAYLEFFEVNPEAKINNAVFGEMNRYEWYLLERKHLNHHFEQFGLI
ncbi:MAG: phenylacetic acid degradation bifunctional protein PaaZ, partial [Flavobacteriaceae bacterium]|nr:phenylacetic acid degradation bifunctional protein PaaZ [Bacteroidia bacterium]NNL61543.1 phenylacetic acid degradation bifunctional protein PaaZ [Flavobacteriaceae bacterium]